VLCPFTESVRLGLFRTAHPGTESVLRRRGRGDGESSRHDRGTTGHEPSLGIADGLSVPRCVRGALSYSSPVRPSRFRRSLHSRPLVEGRRDDLSTTRPATVGSFADLDIARVGERFNKQALVPCNDSAA